MTAALIAALIASPLHAVQLPVVADVQGALESARTAGRRVGIELRNSSMLFGTVVDVRKGRFTLDEQKLGRKTIRYEDIRALLDPATGDEIAAVRFSGAPFQHLSVAARVRIGIAAALATFLLVACVTGACAKT